MFNAAGDNERFANFVQRNWPPCGTANSRQHCHDQYHYADVSNVHIDYQSGYAGTNDHDVVHAINAAVVYLRHRNTGGPFSFADEKEALMLLVHYLGDVHQPMHVVAIYPDQQGNVVNPEGGAYSARNDTGGGNSLHDPATSMSMHTEWDRIPAEVMPGGAQAGSLLGAARKVADTMGDSDSWAQRWASESVTYAPLVFRGLTYAAQPASDPGGAASQWNVAGIDDAYTARADALKGQ
ncbi:S1/P1 nuclease [Duganella sp. HH101]|nr:S1/P1 nuclease [Duganella sp. HH101]